MCRALGAGTIAGRLAFMTSAILPASRARGIALPAMLKGASMFYFAGVPFSIAIMAAILGFGDSAAGMAEIAQRVFQVFLLRALASLVTRLLRR